MGDIKSNYIAKVKLICKDTYTKEWEDEGPAHHVLMAAIRHVGDKDGKGIFTKIIQYAIDDWGAFDSAMNDLFFKKKNERRK